MQLLKYLKMPKSYKLIFLGDLHIGNRGTEYTVINKVIEYIRKTKDVYWNGGGDQVETIDPTDKRFDLDSMDGQYAKVQWQANHFIELFKPIAHRGLWLLDGNHEHKLINTFEITKYIAEQLDMDYGTYMCKADMGAFKILDWHGGFSMNSRAGSRQRRECNENELLYQRLSALSDDCEINIVHHVHKIRIRPPLSIMRMIDDGEQLRHLYAHPARIPIGSGKYYIHEDDRWYASSGSALRTQMLGYSGYGERAGYAPVELGWVYLEVKDNRIVKLDKLVF